MTCGEGRIGNKGRQVGLGWRVDGEHLGISKRNLSAAPDSATAALVSTRAGVVIVVITTVGIVC